MSKLGVNVYLEPQMNHAKVLVVDENEGMIGSNNLDVFSFELNSEIGVFIKDNEAISRVLRIINNWEKESVLFDLKSYKPKWFDYLLSPLIRLLFFV
jgi:phosphatidylserine/phosphatidylglycerophosphate/cardiolipin synthase-like enzyme